MLAIEILLAPEIVAIAPVWVAGYIVGVLIQTGAAFHSVYKLGKMYYEQCIVKKIGAHDEPHCHSPSGDRHQQ